MKPETLYQLSTLEGMVLCAKEVYKARHTSIVYDTARYNGWDETYDYHGRGFFRTYAWG